MSEEERNSGCYQGLRDAIDKVNESDRFERLDKDEDAEIRTDEDSGEIDLMIKVRKLNP